MSRFLLPLESNRLTRYGVGVALALAALLVRLGLDPFLGHFAPWSPFFLAVVLASVVGGFGGGSAAALSTVGLGAYFFLEPRYTFGSIHGSDVASIVVFLAAAMATSWVGHGLRRALARRDSALATVDALIEHSPIGISLFDTKLRFVRVNGVVARTTGIPARDHIGRRISELVPGARGQTEGKVSRVLETGVTIVNDEVVADAPTRPGDERIWQVNVFPVLGSGGKITGIGMLSHDLTEEKRAERARAETLRFAERFIGVLGHDLRNPLGAITMGAVTLRRRSETDADARVIDRILSSAERMDRMVGQLLDLTRGRFGGGIPLERRDGSLSDTVLAATEELRMAYPGRLLQCDVAPDVGGDWDFDRLAQVVSNLVGNALEHGDPTQPVQVRLRANGSAVFEVQNVGPPIPDSEIKRIFEPYRRAEAGQKASGLGLGLFIAKEIVAAHGGWISVRSTEEEGTTFSFSLPGASIRPSLGSAPPPLF